VLFDAAGVSMGRLAVEVAKRLRGKHRPDFTPHVDCGDFVIVTNAASVLMTGNKGEELLYRHSQFPGGLKCRTRAEYKAKFPERSLERVIKGMLPRTSIGASAFRRLKVYAGPEHPHEAQQPEKIEIL